MTATHTRVHVTVGFANPYVLCQTCRNRATGWHDPERCGCGGPYWNEPCRHPPDATSSCPSWGPVDGCRCLAHLGYVPHAEPSEAGGDLAALAAYYDTHDTSAEMEHGQWVDPRGGTRG